MSSENDPATGRNDSDRPASSEPIFNIPGVVLFFLVVSIGIYLAQSYLLGDEANSWLLLYLAFIPVRFSQYGGFSDITAWWTTISYSFLHGSFAHVAVNMVWLAAFGSPLAGRIGTVRMVAFWVLTAVAAAFTHYLLYSDSLTPLVGASGAISGMMGAAARFGFRRVQRGRLPAFAGPLLPVMLTLTLRPVLAFLGVWLAINVVTGLISVVPGESSIAWEAHIGGFLAGFFGISLLDRPVSRDPAR
ncbi:MAG: rhomboid family intramembrane serine protease [Phyllobacterium sp.]